MPGHENPEALVLRSQHPSLPGSWMLARVKTKLLLTASTADGALAQSLSRVGRETTSLWFAYQEKSSRLGEPKSFFSGFIMEKKYATLTLPPQLTLHVRSNGVTFLQWAVKQPGLWSPGGISLTIRGQSTGLASPRYCHSGPHNFCWEGSCVYYRTLG